jgi:hypothetical protein
VTYPFYQRSGVLLGSTSTATSTPVFVGDLRTLTISYQSKASLGASRYTIWGSNSDGFQVTTDPYSSLQTNPSLSTNWSLYSGVNMVGMGTATFSPAGVRWIRASVDVTTQSAASYTTLSYFGTTY